MTDQTVPVLDWDEVALDEPALTRLRRFGETYWDWGLETAVRVWEQWVRELVRGDLWVPFDLESARNTRSGLEDLLRSGTDVAGMDVVAEHVARLDDLYRSWSVDVGPVRHDAWWASREPSRPQQYDHLHAGDRRG